MKFHFDGHGINRSDNPYQGERVLTFARRHKDDGGGYVCSGSEMNQLGPLFAAAPDLLAALETLADAVIESRVTVGDMTQVANAITKARHEA